MNTNRNTFIKNFLDEVIIRIRNGQNRLKIILRNQAHYVVLMRVIGHLVLTNVFFEFYGARGSFVTAQNVCTVIEYFWDQTQNNSIDTFMALFGNQILRLLGKDLANYIAVAFNPSIVNDADAMIVMEKKREVAIGGYLNFIHSNRAQVINTPYYSLNPNQENNGIKNQEKKAPYTSRNGKMYADPDADFEAQIKEAIRLSEEEAKKANEEKNSKAKLEALRRSEQERKKARNSSTDDADFEAQIKKAIRLSEEEAKKAKKEKISRVDLDAEFEEALRLSEEEAKKANNSRQNYSFQKKPPCDGKEDEVENDAEFKEVLLRSIEETDIRKVKKNELGKNDSQPNKKPLSPEEAEKEIEAYRKNRKIERAKIIIERIDDDSIDPSEKDKYCEFICANPRIFTLREFEKASKYITEMMIRNF